MKSSTNVKLSENIRWNYTHKLRVRSTPLYSRTDLQTERQTGCKLFRKMSYY